jgi:hypothetical protein
VVAIEPVGESEDEDVAVAVAEGEGLSAAPPDAATSNGDGNGGLELVEPIDDAEEGAEGDGSDEPS